MALHTGLRMKRMVHYGVWLVIPCIVALFGRTLIFADFIDNVEFPETRERER